MNGSKKPVLILAPLVVVAATGALLYALSNARKGYEPRQPILFRHEKVGYYKVGNTWLEVYKRLPAVISFDYSIFLSQKCGSEHLPQFPVIFYNHDNRHFNLDFLQKH